MRIVFVGASKLGLRCLLQARGTAGCDIVGTVTAPRTFPISYRPQGVVNVLHADVEEYCGEQGIPCAVISKGMKDPALFDLVKSWNPDLFLVVGWYHMVPKAWFDLAPAYGLHASLLPDYSGGAPLVWSMINGEKRTGISLFQFDQGVDSGPILGQKSTDILDEDDISTLLARIEALGLDLIREHLPELAAGRAVPRPQDGAKRRIFPQRGPEDGRIDWSKPAKAIHDFVRAQTRPYPGAFTTWEGEKVSIWRSRLSPMRDGRPGAGEVLRGSGSLLVGTGDGILEVLEAGCGGRDIAGAELGRLLGDGTVLGK